MRRLFIYISTVLLLTTIAKAQYQADTSDAVFSIVMPQPAAQDIDMRECLVGSTKDSVVQDFVVNLGSWKFRVDSIYFQGADAGAFRLVSGFPEYFVEANGTKNTEFRFVPNRAGVHSAEIVIQTQTEKLVKNIYGMGVLPQLAILTDIVDFGKVEVGDDSVKTNVALIKNISSVPITINNVVQLGPDKEQFEILGGGGSFTLQANEERQLTLRFKPIYGGRTSGRLGFEHSGAGSPAIAVLFGTGIGGAIIALDDSAYAGDHRILKLYLQNVKPEGIAALAPNYEATIRIHKNILSPDKLADWHIINDSVYINLKGQIGANNELAQIPVIAGLGNVSQTAVEILDFKLKDVSGNPYEYEFELIAGTFYLLGICEEGGTRLINPTKYGELISISPNPSAGLVSIELNLIESGATSLQISDNSGKIVFDKKIIDYTGNMKLDVDLVKFGSGTYFVNLQTPTIKKTVQVMVVK